MIYMITDHPTNIVHFDIFNEEYCAIKYDREKRINDCVDEIHVTQVEYITEDNIECFAEGEVAHLYEGVYWFAWVTPITMRDVPLDELLWHIFTPEHMMFGKKLYVYCVGDEEFEFACEKIYPDNQLVGTKTIWNRDTFFELCGISLDVDDCFEHDGDIVGSGLQCVGNGKVQVVDWSLFFEYVAKNWEIDFVYGGE